MREAVPYVELHGGDVGGDGAGDMQSDLVKTED
jgi:hypothetical protein